MAERFTWISPWKRPDWQAFADGMMQRLERVLVSPGPFRSLRYGTTVTPDISQPQHGMVICSLVVPNGVAFTMANPPVIPNGGLVVFYIENASGGAMGAITWGSRYFLAGAFTNPATGTVRTITFFGDGDDLVEIARAAADI